MGVARSRSHRAGGRPSTRTRTLLPHAVRVAVAAEARGGTAQGSTHLCFVVTRLTRQNPEAGQSPEAEPSVRIGLETIRG